MKALKRNIWYLAGFVGTVSLLVSAKLLMESGTFGTDIWKGGFGMETVTNDLVVALLGMFAVLIAVSQLKAVQRAVGMRRIRSILNAALFTALFVPFAWACLSLCSRIGGNVADMYVLILIGMSFLLVMHADRLAFRERKKMQARTAQAGVMCYAMDYGQVIEMIREQNKDAVGKVILFGMPKSLTDISVCGSIQIGREEILSYARRHFGRNITNLIHDPDIRRVVFLAA